MFQFCINQSCVSCAHVHVHGVHGTVAKSISLPSLDRLECCTREGHALHPPRHLVYPRVRWLGLHSQPSSLSSSEIMFDKIHETRECSTRPSGLRSCRITYLFEGTTQSSNKSLLNFFGQKASPTSSCASERRKE